MKERLTVDELKKYELDILKFIDYVCKKYNIKYFVSYGTLLGAVRHKGFIPWDDDIDVAMYREDYERFQKAVIEENNDRYTILSKDNSDWYFQNFLVVIDKHTLLEDSVKRNRKDSNVFVDVFPVDRFNDLNFVKKAHLMVTLKHICFIKKKYIIHKDSRIKDFCRVVFWHLLAFVNPRFFTKKIQKLVEITPETATILKNGIETVITLDEIQKGDILITKPGQKIAVDGEIVERTCTF